MDSISNNALRDFHYTKKVDNTSFMVNCARGRFLKPCSLNEEGEERDEEGGDGGEITSRINAGHVESEHERFFRGGPFVLHRSNTRESIHTHRPTSEMNENV